jgi:NAD(P)-dependent dehydrogenase (short-subunit alcohol dehydrogenase family)
MTNNMFDSRVCLVTGAGSGIGKAIAIAFAKSGARVIAADIIADSADTTAAEIGDDAIAVAVDIASEPSVLELKARALDAFGHVDVLCNNAGIVDTMSLPADMSVGEWERVLRVNLTGTFLVTRMLLPHMLSRGSGVIINTASEASIRGAAAGSVRW